MHVPKLKPKQSEVPSAVLALPCGKSALGTFGRRSPTACGGGGRCIKLKPCVDPWLEKAPTFVFNRRLKKKSDDISIQDRILINKAHYENRILIFDKVNK